jgi:hypothetical protein
MASYPDPFGYAYPPASNPLVTPSVAFALPDGWLRQTVPQPWPSSGSPATAAPSGILGARFSAQPPFPDTYSGGLLGGLPMMRPDAPGPSGGILQDKVPDTSAEASNTDNFANLLDTRPFTNPYFPFTPIGSELDSDLAAAGPTVDGNRPRTGLDFKPRPFGTAASPVAPEPWLPNRIASRIAEEFGDAFNGDSLGRDYRAAIDPLVRKTGTWTDYLPLRTLNAALFWGVPGALDVLRRGLAASYYSATDAGAEGLVSLGFQRNTTESAGRELKAWPEAFAGSPGFLRPMAAAVAAAPAIQVTGQMHHGISRRIHRALEQHPNLWGYYEYRDGRFQTQALDSIAHRGYQKWHRALDAEIADHIRGVPWLTPEGFETYLQWRYDQDDLRARFPNGL